MLRIWSETFIFAISEDTEFLGTLVRQIDSHFHLKVFDREAVRTGDLGDCDNSLILWDLTSIPAQELNPFLSAHPALLRTCSLLLICDETCIEEATLITEEGAVDFIVKPVRPQELRSRLRLGRRPWVQAMRTTFDFMGSFKLEFTTTEQRILLCFLASPDFTVSRSELNKELWRTSSVNSNSLDVHLFNIRKKIERTGLQIRFNNKLGAWILSQYRQTEPRDESDKRGQ